MGKLSIPQLALIGSILGFVGGSAHELLDIFSMFPNAPAYVHLVTGAAGYIGGIIGLIVAYQTRISAQGQNVLTQLDTNQALKEQIVVGVSHLPDVATLDIKKSASGTLGKLADDPAQDKINRAA